MAKKDEKEQGQGQGQGAASVTGDVKGGNSFVGFFKKLGKVFGKLGWLLGFVLHTFTEAQFDAALTIAREAVDKFADNANRRTWVVHELTTRLHLPDSVARFLLEAVVQYAKRAEDDLFDKLDDILTPAQLAALETAEPVVPPVETA